MAAPGAGPGPGAPPGLEAALQKLALRRKKVLSAEETELFELAQAAGGAMDPEVFKILVDLLKLNVAPLAVFQMLKSMCAGQRLASEPQDPVAVPLPTTSVPETRGQSWAWAAGVGREREVGSAWHIGACLALSSQAFLLLLSRDCSKDWPFGLLSPASTLLPPSRMHIQIR
uniref:Mitotic-spindle organizing protein 2B n=1 Tax=Sus scrofa TaxID=9823 RepID=A0A8D0MQG6_PIG